RRLSSCRRYSEGCDRSGVLVPQEPLELGRQFLAGWYVTGTEQMCLLLGLFVDLFELVDHRTMFVVACDELVEPLALDDGLLPYRSGVDDEPGDVVQPSEECERRGGIAESADVVRDLSPDTQSGHSLLGERVLEHCTHAGGNV